MVFSVNWTKSFQNQSGNQNVLVPELEPKSFTCLA